MKIGETRYFSSGSITLIKDAQKSGTNTRGVAIEKEIRTAKNAADFRILEFNGTPRMYAYMDNAKENRWYSAKEFQALVNAGKSIVTDF